MSNKNLLIFTLVVLLTGVSCNKLKDHQTDEEAIHQIDYEQERIAILQTLNNETKAAFERDYESWKNNWVHDPQITKGYINFVDSTFSESVGWDEISQFVRTFFEEQPEAEPVPKLLDRIDIRLYKDGAWVVYKLQDSLRGLKRETRLMEKLNGQWKIAGMQTTIYGFDKKHPNYINSFP